MATTKKQETSVAADIVAEDEKAVKPANSPALRPWATLTRRQRADFQKTWGANLPTDVLDKIGSEDGAGELDIAAIGLNFAFSFLADVEDALAIVAINTDLYRKWAERVSDEELQDLFHWYQETQASGE